MFELRVRVLVIGCLAAAAAASGALSKKTPRTQKGRHHFSRAAGSAWDVESISELFASQKEAEECQGTSATSHMHLLSPATSCCYARIVRNSSCCMDERIATGVQRRQIQRPGMHWTCNDDNCYDDVSGERGKDTLWIPDGANCTTPRLLYTHGGSWMYGSPDTDSYAQLGSRLAKKTGAMVMLTDYPLVPAGNYSSILQWAITALQWLDTHGPIDDCPHDSHAPLFIGGDSSGGGTTMSLLLTLQAEPELISRPLAGAFFYSPWTNLMCNTPEYYTNAFAKIKGGEKKFKDMSKLSMYVGDIMFQDVTPENSDAFSGNAVEYLSGAKELQTDPVASPFFAGPQHFSRDTMPPMLVIVGGSESILGDSVHVAQMAAQGGADVILEIYNGMWHVFPMYSEGCGGGVELWAGAHAINSTGLFVRHIYQTGRLPYQVKLEGPVDGEKPENSVLADWWEPGKSKVPVTRMMYDPHVHHFMKVGELMPFRDAGYGYNDFMKDVAKQSPWIVLPSITGAAVLIFMSGVLLGGVIEFSTERCVNRCKRIARFRREEAEEDNQPQTQTSKEVPLLQGSALDRRNTFRQVRKRPSFVWDFVQGVPDS